MKSNGPNSGTSGRHESVEHEEFLELCALSTSDALTADEQSRLDDHLAVCDACSAALRDYEQLAHAGMASLADSFLPFAPAAVSSESVESTKRKLFETISMGNGEASVNLEHASPRSSSIDPRADLVRKKSVLNLSSNVQVFLRYAAGLILVAGLMAAAYRFGERKVAQQDSSTERSFLGMDTTLKQEVASLAKERQALALQVQQREQALERLTTQLNQRSAEVSRLKEESQVAQDASLQASKAGNQLALQRDEVNQKLRAAQASLAQIQDQAKSLQQERNDDLFRATRLEERIAELSDSLKDRDDAVAQQQQLLSSDRDIRELMGARDLYIAEVYDVARNGHTQKPFGRVFFTKDKFLIFYAYDLKEQPGVTNASTFQAWGQRGPELSGAVSLGIFYVDSAAKRRWVLKVNDPKALQQIDAVFVTVEPNGGSPKPTGKRLLFAYLRVDPNHP
jgi:predicted  nucleic acid-binding Zn-ribbon protein